MSKGRVAVLGAGIMGVCTALNLARRGFSVVIFDADRTPLQGASRWNEGKIHLGYLYAADPSLRTMRQVIDGGLTFAPLIRDLLGTDLDDITEDDDLYLVHRNSVAAPDQMESYFRSVSQSIREHPSARYYLADASSAEAIRLTPSELAAISDTPLIVAGFRTPERSLSTIAVADKLTAALRSEPGIELRLGQFVESALPADSDDGPWRISCTSHVEDTFDWVINALWHGRIAVDAKLGLAPAEPWSHRYRVSAFVRSAARVAIPSAVIAVGPFGDIKNYNGRDFYVSWYDAGLLAEAQSIEPPRAPSLDALSKERITAGIREGLAPFFPHLGDLFREADSVRIEGGYVFAAGHGSLADRSASIHRRDRFGIASRGRYLSVDTGKYSSAPLLAVEIAKALAGD